MSNCEETIKVKDITVKQAMAVLKLAMEEDPETKGSYASVWHDNVACMVSDAIQASPRINDTFDFGLSQEVGNDAASRVMKLVFGVTTKWR